MGGCAISGQRISRCAASGQRTEANLRSARQNFEGSITEGGIGRVQRVRCNVIDWAGFRGCGQGSEGAGIGASLSSERGRCLCDDVR